MIKKALFVLVFLIIASCKIEKKNIGYEIHGNVKGFNDSICEIFQWDYESVYFKDSVLVKDGKFKFSGTIDRPRRTTLKIKGMPGTMFFWLENTQTTVTINDDGLKKAIVVGGEAQGMANLHELKKRPISNKIDSLGNIIMTGRKTGNLTDQEQDTLYLRMQALNEELYEVTNAFIRDFPNSLESARTLNESRFRLDKELFTELFTLMNDKTQASIYGKEIARYLKLNVNPQIGDKYVDFELNNINGQKTKISDLRERYTLIEFWASWCSPCRESNPALKKVYGKFHDKGFNIVGVSMDHVQEKWLKAIMEDSLPWDHVLNEKGPWGDVATIYNLKGVPDNILIDDKGRVIARGLVVDDLEAKLEMEFNEK
ncbi:TlpA disulfide reductase family protein [Arenibacter sp. S6351L]|uniref:TlpA disulfide reductase family protein n=1 Tax=Arenibacter sp. S6351L TaxID=2926407 RepID=UPI001FF166C3|nr:TlpA disulfide reductase family protein [Arenibacter sp. S6351L]MCK0137304.1 AhpC/TSA family protein [Arenibacter sp. S6351L]